MTAYINQEFARIKGEAEEKTNFVNTDVQSLIWVKNSKNDPVNDPEKIDGMMSPSATAYLMQ